MTGIRRIEEARISPREALLAASDPVPARRIALSSAHSVSPWTANSLGSPKPGQLGGISKLRHPGGLSSLASGSKRASIPSPRRDLDALAAAPHLGVSGLRLKDKGRLHHAFSSGLLPAKSDAGTPTVRLAPERDLIRRGMYFSVGADDDVRAPTFPPAQSARDDGH